MTFENGVRADEIKGARWRKASASTGKGECVEVAALGKGEVAMRNSRFPSGPALVFTPQEWTAFLSAAKAEEFDTLT
ncbi:DUF397 domain-containing protein [Streptomyces termitum]|uniref:Transcriptional regulator n=1 Tax=Streptomyces termitum TaxID=67368 RepID=A0A918W7P4_9ACTN|nr:DUF397 domain-containing protein [Streptomyces termitum]GHA78221.1 transcriptional regulator [Streptomyces termitum]